MMNKPLFCLAAGLLFFFLALVVKPSPYRRLFMVPITLAIIGFFQSRPHYQYQIQYACVCVVVLLFFSAIDYILLTDAQKELFKQGQKEPIYQRPLFERAKWAIELIFNHPCVGWSHEPTYALPRRIPPSYTRSTFFLHQLRHLATDLALYEFTRRYFMKGNPCFMEHGYSMRHDGILWSCINYIVVCVAMFTQTNMQHRILGIIFILSGIKQPQEWAHLFGSLSDAYSVRTFWGRFWHQVFRRPLDSHGRFVAYRVLRLKKGSRASNLVQLCIAFAISGVIHVAADYSVMGRLSFGALRLFLLQIPVIVFEDLVVKTSRKFSIPNSWYWIGYIWVLAWGSFSGPIWFDPLFRSGFGDTMLKFSVLDYFLRE